MNRKEFIAKCAFTCIGVKSLLLQSCATQAVVVSITSDGFLVPLQAFEKNGNFKKYVIVYPTTLSFPVCIYRNSESEYSALLMECTHNGAELQVYGSVLQCPAHGSEFSNSGEVVSGPAYKALKSFPTSIENSNLKILL